MNESLNHGIGFQPMIQVSGERRRLACWRCRPRHRELFGNSHCLLIFAMISLIAPAPSLAAGVVLDGSFGTSGALPGPNYMIQASFGKTVGNNLFQSFNQFNLISSESATFTGPSNVQNILARVTSGSPSSIDGKISSQIQGANLFFLNPAGVMFGPHAQLDVSGSVAVTTADYVKLVGGGRFNANLGAQDTLTSASVSAFGFLNSAPASVSFTGSNLNIAPQKSFSVVAGDIAMDGSAIFGQGSRINLVSVRSPGEAQLDTTALDSAIDVSQFSAMGEVDLTNSAQIDTSGPAGGPISLYGGRLVLNPALILSATTGAAAGGPVDINMRDSIHIFGGGELLRPPGTNFLAGIITVAVAAGDGGKVTISARSLTIDGSTANPASPFPGAFTGIASATQFTATGNAGDMRIEVTDALQLIDGGSIIGQTFSFGKGPEVFVHAGSLTIVDSIAAVQTREQSGIATQTGTLYSGDVGEGNAGDLIVQVAGRLNIDAGHISAATSRAGNGGNVFVQADTINITEGGDIDAATAGPTDTGNGGNVVVEANALTIDGSANPSFFTGILATASGGNGNAGNLAVHIFGPLTILNGGVIDAETFSQGNGGNLLIQAGSLTIDGSGALGNHVTGIFVDTFGSGNAGKSTIEVNGALNLTGTGEITANTFSSGVGGSVAVQAASLNIDGSASQEFLTGISSSALDVANAGDVHVTVAGLLKITGGGLILAASLTSATAGSVELDVNKLRLDSNSTVSSQNTAGGMAGSVVIDATGPVNLSHGSRISTSSAASDAGSIQLTSSAPITLSDRSSITASAGRDGGNIHLTCPSLVYLQHSSITATAGASGGGGMGGNITIDPQFIILNNSPISANAAAGQGGNISLVSDFFFASSSPVTATGTVANGTVNITAPQLDLGAELITLPSSLVDAQNQLRERCTALLQGDFSSFISIGRGGTESEPEELEDEF
jgi:filamentous hemagglutinin family protein